MAITINIYYSGENHNAKKFAEEMTKNGIVQKIRSESGNLRYEYFFPMSNTKTVLLIDSWENKDAINQHHASPMMDEIIELRNKYDLHMKVERYISDDDAPTTDQDFIRK